MHRDFWEYLPASDGEGGAGGGIGALSREGGVADGRAGRDGGGQVPDSNVVVDLSRVVRRVVLDGRDANLGTARRPGLEMCVSTYVTPWERNLGQERRPVRDLKI